MSAKAHGSEMTPGTERMTYGMSRYGCQRHAGVRGCEGVERMYGM